MAGNELWLRCGYGFIFWRLPRRAPTLSGLGNLWSPGRRSLSLAGRPRLGGDPALARRAGIAVGAVPRGPDPAGSVHRARARTAARRVRRTADVARNHPLRHAPRSG